MSCTVLNHIRSRVSLGLGTAPWRRRTGTSSTVKLPGWPCSVRRCREKWQFWHEQVAKISAIVQISTNFNFKKLVLYMLHIYIMYVSKQCVWNTCRIYQNIYKIIKIGVMDMTSKWRGVINGNFSAARSDHWSSCSSCCLDHICFCGMRPIDAAYVDLLTADRSLRSLCCWSKSTATTVNCGFGFAEGSWRACSMWLKLGKGPFRENYLN